MRELKILSTIVIVCVVGVTVSFGGSLWTAYQDYKKRSAEVRPEDQIPVPATAN